MKVRDDYFKYLEDLLQILSNRLSAISLPLEYERFKAVENIIYDYLRNEIQINDLTSPVHSAMINGDALYLTARLEKPISKTLETFNTIRLLTPVPSLQSKMYFETLVFKNYGETLKESKRVYKIYEALDADVVLKDDVPIRTKQQILALNNTTLSLQSNLHIYNDFKENGFYFYNILSKSTTPICRERTLASWTQKKPYDVNKGIPPLHYRCRSKLVPIIK